MGIFEETAKKRLAERQDEIKKHVELEQERSKLARDISGDFVSYMNNTHNVHNIEPTGDGNQITLRLKLSSRSLIITGLGADEFTVFEPANKQPGQGQGRINRDGMTNSVLDWVERPRKQGSTN